MSDLVVDGSSTLVTESDWEYVSRIRKVESGLARQGHEEALAAADARTKVGAVIRTRSGQLAASNGPLSARSGRHGHTSSYPNLSKQAFMRHAERTAIFKMLWSGLPGEGATLFVTEIPCADCCQDIVMGGIAKVHVCWWWFNHRIHFGPSPLPALRTALDLLTPNGIEFFFDRDGNQHVVARRDDMEFVPAAFWFEERNLDSHL